MRKLIIGFLFIFSVSTLYALSAERILFNEAESRYKNGDLDFALSRYEDLLQEYPLSEYAPDAYFRIAVITLRSGALEEAESLFFRVEKRYMNTRFIDYLPFWKGLIKFKQDQWDEASDLFALFLENNPVSLVREAYLYRAKAEYTAGRIKSAISILDAWFETAVDIYGDPYLFTFYLTLLERDGRYESVLNLSGRITDGLFETSWMERLYLIHAESLYKTGDISEAEIYYQKILSADPDISSIGFIRLFSIYKNDTLKQGGIFDKAQVQLSGHPLMLNKFLLRVGIDSYNNGHFELAASYLQRIWRTSDISEINSLVPVYLAKILVSEGDRIGAADILSSYSNSVATSDELVLYTLSNVLVEDGNWKDAEGYLKDFIFTFPNSDYYSSATWMYAYSLYRSGKFSESKSVIDFVLANGTGGSYTTDFILLSARVYIKLDNIPNALAMFKEYLPFDNSNTEIWFDIIKLQFIQGDYKAVSGTYKKLKEGFQSDKKNQFILLIEYIAGLADIAEGRYTEGLDKLSHISRDILGQAELAGISPYVAYYRGWASYRLSDYRESFIWFELVADEYSESSVYTEALYFAGWSLYLMGDYSRAAKYFADFSTLAADGDKVKGLFFYGKSVYAAGDLNEAEIIFQNIYAEYPRASYADDAVFEHGQILENLGEYNLAVSAYKELYKRYRTSSLAEESLFKVGELYLLLDMYEEARDAFYFHRLKFPKGILGDVSLYWGAEAAGEMGEVYGAVLLLEKLLNGYPDSSFRPNAMQKIASAYAGEGEYRKALAYYSDLLTNYAESDFAVDARTQIKKLTLLQSGVDEEEAELLVLIENRGTESEESREAHIELARIYLYKFIGREKEAFGLLNTIALLKDSYPRSAAKAVYYLGDYYFLQNDYTNAAKSFIAAATIYPENRDLMAVSLLRASEMAIAAGDRQTAVKMVNLLEINFPSSEWLKEGRTILEKTK